MQRWAIGQLVRFGVVGVAATFVHVTALVVLVELLDAHPSPANMAAFASAVAVSYLGNYHWTYKSRAGHVTSFARFTAVALLAAAFNYGIFALLVDAWEIHYLIAVFVVVGTVPILSFAIQRSWVFRI